MLTTSLPPPPHLAPAPACTAQTGCTESTAGTCADTPPEINNKLPCTAVGVGYVLTGSLVEGDYGG